jgi:nitroimidazol reductase NimA-like FMN-containing flavoprotein (pyridoxamine 5'-phosphate oxidase superfamily)
MDFRPADPEFKAMQEQEVTELLNQPNYLRVAMINERDGTPLVHPMWYYYEDGKFLPSAIERVQRSGRLKRIRRSIFSLTSLIEVSAAEGRQKSSTTLRML